MKVSGREVAFQMRSSEERSGLMVRQLRVLSNDIQGNESVRGHTGEKFRSRTGLATEL